MTMKLTVSVLLLFASALCGQTTGSSRLVTSSSITALPSGSGGSILIGPTSSTAEATLVMPTMSSGIATTVTWCGNGWCAGTMNGGIPQEARKATGPMPTIAQVRAASYHLGARIVPANYIKLAHDVGVGPSAEEAQIDQAISDLNLNVYPFDKVDNYLYRNALKLGANVHWVWKPARQKDAGVISEASLGFSSTGATAAGLVSAKLYTQIIPEQVLVEMSALLDVIPDAMFLVSDYEVMKPDPFLAVTTKNLLSAGKVWIIESWLEPGFGGDKESQESAMLAKR